jgi:hypothetical protein
MTKARDLSQVPNAFSPTALLVLTHNVTGLKYFCKTSQLDKLQYYKGSGVYWKRHRKVHGSDIKVGVLGLYYDKDRCTAAALKFSKEHNIVQSEEWANLIEENGLDGQGLGENHVLYGKPSKCIGQKRPQTSAKVKGCLNGMYGKPSPMRGVAKPKGKDSPLYGRKRPEGGGKTSKPVVREDGKVYASISEAAKDVNGHGTTISNCCLGKSKTAYGFKWSYK